MSINYQTAHQIYYSVNVKGKLMKEEDKFFNIYAKFVSNSDQHSIIILEDYSLDCNFHIIVSKEVYERLKNYFEPFYIFRFDKLKFTTFNPNFDQNLKRIYFKFDDMDLVVIFKLISGLNERFNFHLTDNQPRIDESDWLIIDGLRDKFARKEFTPIDELADKFKEGIQKNSTLELKWRQKLVNFSFLAQIVEINQIKFDQIVIKVFDGTIPKFEVKHPIDGRSLVSKHVNVQLNQANTLLYGKSKEKIIYVSIRGEKFVQLFDDKGPGDLVLFYNARISETTSVSSYFRIELNSSCFSQNKQLIRFIEVNSNLGQFLLKRINSVNGITGYISNDLDSRSTNTSIGTGYSFIHYNLLLNQISSPIHDFTHIKESFKNYQVYCTILDLYPLDYIALDFIRMRCSKCDLDGSVNNLFSFDLKGLSEATDLFYSQYKKNEGMQCPNCSEESSSFYFHVLFYLQDETAIEQEDHRMFAVLSDNDADFYFDLNPIEVVANYKDGQYNLIKKIDFIREKFTQFNRSSHMIIRADIENDLYTIKTIYIDYD